ncbi:MAG: DUF4349 domain-containing protein [Dehalococcoidia bacterium]|nr:DUF4349 domain-containing protein [Dehalococcoidia bacterium]MDW8120622.1 DUF4349 domain-containing protein [Chloroflexota bacterium]
MTQQQQPLDEVERAVRDFFHRAVAGRRAPANLWARLAPRLEPRLAPSHAQVAQRPRLGWLAPAVAGVVLVVVGASLAWLVLSAPWREGVPATPSALPADVGGMKPLPPGAILPEVATPAPALAPERKGAEGVPSSPAPTGVLETAQRQVILTASMSLEVSSVERAVAEARAIAEGLGGFVQQLSLTGGKDNPQATLTLRVPQEQVFTALERLRGLGTLLAQSLGSQDVTEQVIDLDARLRALQREEQSLLALLGRAHSVGDILAIERELSRIRGEIERLQGQLQALRRRVELATITLTLTSPRRDVGTPPSASLGVAVSRVAPTVEQVKALVVARRGVVEGVFLVVQDGQERAEMSLRVFRQDFSSLLTALEGLGQVRHKEVREGAPPKNGLTPQEPDAPIVLSLVEREEWWTPGRRWAVGLGAGGMLVVGLGVLALRLRRRRAL